MQRTGTSHLAFNPIQAFHEHHESHKVTSQIESIISNMNRPGCNVTESFNQITTVLLQSEVHHVSGELLMKVYSLGMRQVNYNLMQRSQGAYARVDFSVEEIRASYNLVHIITEKYSDKVQAHYSQTSSVEIELNAFQQHIERFNSMQTVGGQFTQVSETLVQMISIHIKLTTQNSYVMAPVNHEKLTSMFNCYQIFLREKFEYVEGRCSEHCSKCLHDICDMMISFQNKFSVRIQANAQMCHETVSFVGVMVNKFHNHLHSHHFHAAISMHISIWKNCEAHVRIKILETLSCGHEKLRDLLIFVRTAIGAGVYFVLEETRCIIEGLFKLITSAARHTAEFIVDISCKIVAEFSLGLHLLCQASARLFEASMHMMLDFAYGLLHAGKVVGNGVKFILQLFMSMVSSCNKAKYPIIQMQDIQYIEQISVQYQCTALTQEVYTYRENRRNVA